MYPCIEAIEWKDGAAQRLNYHQSRVEAAFQCLFPDKQAFNLRNELEKIREKKLQVMDSSDKPESLFDKESPFFPEKGKYKLRLLFDDQLRSVEFQEYQLRNITSLKLMNIQYETTTYKSSSRRPIEEVFAGRGTCDDVLLVRDGLLTDTSYANIALFDGQKWISPRIPLLYGTRRAYLLDHQDIEIADIRVEELAHFQRIRLFNALIDFGDIDLPVASIIT